MEGGGGGGSYENAFQIPGLFKGGRKKGGMSPKL